jgi:aminoglycoside phosphotransferase family enzyme/predicted kinase
MASDQHNALVGSLLRPEAYPGQVSDVELVETYISYLFLTGRHVYKVKKPVDYGFLDFTTLEKRRYYCHQEVELNRRLSPEVYLGVVEIRELNGQYAIEGPGQTVEYAVKMLQLPRHRAMNALLQEDKVSEGDIRRLAARIADFHSRAETSPEISRLGGLEAVRQNVEENFSQTEKFLGVCLSADAFDDLVAYSRAFLEVKKELFQRRASQGRIRDCHGDLHTAQIFLENGISIIDCIEFNDRFRCSDVAEDIAFLAMDLDYHHRPDLSRLFIETYVQESNDSGVLDLLDFFKSYRAYVRGKVTSFRLDDPALTDEGKEKARASARAYFELARSYIRVFPRPAMVLVVGLTGTGKSTVAQELARRWNFSYVSSDITRKALAGIAPDERRYESFGEGIYSPEFSRRTYDAMFRQAEQCLQDGRSVVLDGTFRSAVERSRAIEAARRGGADAWIIECSLPEEEVRRRLERRTREETSASDARWELFHRLQQEWEPVTEAPGNRYLRLDTSAPTPETMRRLLRELYARVLVDNS